MPADLEALAQLGFRPDNGRLQHESFALPETSRGFERVLSRLVEIGPIPSNSGDELLMIRYLQELADSRQWKRFEDEAGNQAMIVPATPGFEKKPGTVLTFHTDMVCRAEPGKRNPAQHGVSLHLEQDQETGEFWVAADGTTAGIDDRLGMAIALDVATNDSPHGEILLVGTTREETGLDGAQELAITGIDTSNYRYLFNLDSNKENLIIGCAGAGKTTVNLATERTQLNGRQLLSIDIAGLGANADRHSGHYIHTATSAIPAVASVIQRIKNQFTTADLVTIQGGEVDNSIAIHTTAIIAVDPSDAEAITELIGREQERLRQDALNDKERQLELKVGTPDLTSVPADPENLSTIEKAIQAVKELSDDAIVMDDASTKRVLGLVGALPHGIKRMLSKFPHIPATSSNLGVVKTNQNGISIDMLTRSSVPSELDELREKIDTAALAWKATTLQKPAYTGFEIDPDSEIVELVQASYQKVTGGKKLNLEPTPGGIELGIFLHYHLFKHLQGVSFGSQIQGAHTPGEKGNYASMDRFYATTREAIDRIAHMPDLD